MSKNKLVFNSITEAINQVHLNNNSTLGCNEIGSKNASPLTPDINLSSAYAFSNFKELEKYHIDPINNQRYSRDSNAISRQVELYFSKIYDDSNTFLFNSGMSAIMAAVSILAEEVDMIVTFGIYYRKTESIINMLSKTRGINVINLENEKEIENLDKTKRILFVLEVPSNPFLRLIDIKKIKDSFIFSKIILDFTLSGLLNCTDMINLADISISSCTKYISGHNDLLGGLVVIKNDSLSRRIWDYRSMAGTLIDPFSSYLLLRSLRTYDLRLSSMLDNIKYVLDYLNDSGFVRRIFYPGLYDNSDQNKLVDNYLTHSGSLVSFALDPNIDLRHNIEQLCSIKMAPSFGSIDSLIEIPLYMSRVSESVKISSSSDLMRDLLLSQSFCRLSVGCEPIKYLMNDLDKLIRLS